MAVSAVQAIADGFKLIDGKLRQKNKEGCMATLAFLIQDQLIVATAGSPMAMIDSGSDVLEVRQCISLPAHMCHAIVLDIAFLSASDHVWDFAGST